MKTILAVMAAALLISSCGVDLRSQCNAKHPNDAAAAENCVQKVQHRILTGPGSPFAKSQRGGPG